MIVLGQVPSFDIMEVDLPERVAVLCSLDLTNGFVFNVLGDRLRAWDVVNRDEPLRMIGSPPCTV